MSKSELELRQEVIGAIRETLGADVYEEDVDIIMMGLEGDESPDEIQVRVNDTLLQLSYV